MGEIGFVLFGEGGDGEGVPAEGVGVAKVGFQLAADGGDPDQGKSFDQRVLCAKARQRFSFGNTS